MNCTICRGGTNIPETEVMQEDEHGKFRVCPACGGSANINGEPFKEVNAMNIPDFQTITTAEQAQDLAIEWSNWQNEQDLSYGELAEWNVFFRGLVSKFPELKEEFKENAII